MKKPLLICIVIGILLFTGCAGTTINHYYLDPNVDPPQMIEIKTEKKASTFDVWLNRIGIGACLLVVGLAL